MNDILKKGGAIVPSRTYMRSDTFQGLMWLKFESPVSANIAISVLKDKVAKDLLTQTWYNYDLTIEQRLPKRFLFALKAQLVEWKVGLKKYFHVDIETNKLSAGGKEVASASVAGDTFQVDWLSPEWDTWTELKESAELKQLISTAQDKLARSRSEKGKGKGVGKDSL